MRTAAAFVLIVLLGCGSEAQPESVTEEVEPSASPLAAEAPREALADIPSREPSPDDLLTPEERCSLEGASVDCLVRLAEDIEDEDPERARSLFEQACFDGSTDACDRLGH